MRTEETNGWRARCCETLGLKPGAQAHEIKAAYRDLAKVWHPDRFTHDPRLQAKAQEKLKEINEVYRRLLAGPPTPPRAARPATRHESQATPRDAQTAREAWGDAAGGDAARARKKFDWRLVIPALAFCATFAFVTPRLLPSRRATTARADESATRQPAEAQAAGAGDGGAGVAEQKDARARKAAESSRPRADSAETLPRADSAADAGGAKEVVARAAIPTVSVTVDAATNLLARPGCPGKLRVTFPAGEEPRAYCAAEHGRADPAAAAAPAENAQGKSRLKSFAGRLAAPSKWVSDKDSPGRPAKKSAAQEQSPDQH